MDVLNYVLTIIVPVVTSVSGVFIACGVVVHKVKKLLYTTKDCSEKLIEIKKLKEENKFLQQENIDYKNMHIQDRMMLSKIYFKKREGQENGNK